MSGHHRAFLPAGQLTEMCAAEIDSSFGLIEQSIGVDVGGGLGPMNPGTKIVGNLMPINRDSFAWSAPWPGCSLSTAPRARAICWGIGKASNASAGLPAT